MTAPFAAMQESDFAQSISRCWLEDPDRRRPGEPRTDGDQETIHLRHEQRRARAGRRRDARHVAISHAIYLKHVDKTRSTTDVNAPAFGVDKEIVDIAAGFSFRDRFAVGHGEDGQLGGAAERHEKSASVAIESHRKIAALVHRPGGNRVSGVSVHDCDGVGIGQVDEDPIGVGVDLEAFVKEAGLPGDGFGGRFRMLPFGSFKA